MAPTGPLAWESPYAAGAAQEIAKRQKKKKKKKEKRKRKEKRKVFPQGVETKEL